MECFQPQVSVTNWNIPCVFTYPTPPYMTLRIIIGLRPDPPPVSPRYLLDMAPRISSPDDRQYFMLKETQAGGATGTNIYRKQNSKKSQIHDMSNKWMVYNNGPGLLAMLGQNSRSAMFEITNYSQGSSGNKMPVTLKLDGAENYLSYESGQLKLVNKNNVGTLDQIDDSTKQFLFLRTKNIVNVQFESAVSPGMFICTTPGNASQVSISPGSDQSKITTFIIDSEMGGSFLRVGNRISVQAPRQILESLAENDKLMSNTYDRFPNRTFGNYVCW